MIIRRALRLMQSLTFVGTVAALVLCASSLAACTASFAGANVNKVETAVEAAAAASLDQVPQTLQQFAGQVTTLDAQLEQARRVEAGLQQTLPAQAVAGVTGQLQQLADQAQPEDGRTLQLDVQLEPALNLLDSAAHGANQLDQALDDLDRVARLAPNLSRSLNDHPILGESLNSLPTPDGSNDVEYLLDPTPYLQSFALSVEAFQDWAAALGSPFAGSATSDNTPTLDLAPYMLAALEFMAGTETTLAQFNAALTAFLQAGQLGTDIADATRMGTEFAESLAQSLGALDGQQTNLEQVGPFLEAVPAHGAALLLQAQQATTGLETAAGTGHVQQVGIPVAAALDIMGRIARSSEQVGQTRRLVEETSQLAPELAEAIGQRERASVALMQLSGTLDELNRALVLQPDQQQAIAHAAALVQSWAIQASGLYPEAVMDYRTAAHLDPRIDTLAGLLNQVELELKELSSALIGFDQAFQDAPELADVIVSQAGAGVNPALSLAVLNLLNQLLLLDPEQQQSLVHAVMLMQAWVAEASTLFPEAVPATTPALDLEPQVAALAALLSQAEPQVQQLDSTLSGVDQALRNAPALAALLASQINAGIDPALSLEALNILHQTLVLAPEQQQALARAVPLIQAWVAEASTPFPEAGSTAAPALDLEPQVAALAALLSQAEPQLRQLDSALAGVDQALRNAPALAAFLASQIDAGIDPAQSLEALNVLHQLLVLEPEQQQALAHAVPLIQSWVAEASMPFPEAGSTAAPALDLEPQVAALAALLSQAEPQVQQLDSALLGVDQALRNAPALAAFLASQIDTEIDPAQSLEALNVLHQLLVLEPEQQQALAHAVPLIQSWVAEASMPFPEAGSTAAPALDLEPQVAALAALLSQAEPQLRQLDSALPGVDQALQRVPGLTTLIATQINAGVDPVPALEALNVLHQVLVLEPEQQQTLARTASLMGTWVAEVSTLFPEAVITAPALDLEPQAAALAALLSQAEPQVQQLDSTLRRVDRALQGTSDLTAYIASQIDAGVDPALSLEALGILHQVLVLEPEQQQALARTVPLLQAWAVDVTTLVPGAVSTMGPELDLEPQVTVLAGMLIGTALGAQGLNDALSGLDLALQYIPALVDAVGQFDAASDLLLFLEAPERLNRTSASAVDQFRGLVDSAAQLEGWANQLTGLVPGVPGAGAAPIDLDPQLVAAFDFLGRAQTHMLRLNTALVRLELAAQQAPLLAHAESGEGVARLVAGPLETAGRTVQAIASGTEAVAALDFGDGPQSQVERWSAELAQVLGAPPRLVEDIGRQAGEAGSLIGPLAASDQPLQLQPTPRLVGMFRSISATSALAQGWAYELAGRYPEAVSGYSQALLFNPELTWALSARGRVRWHLGQLAEGLADLNQAILLDPQLAEAYRLRGHVYRELGQPLQAISNYDEALRLSPDDAATLIGRGELNEQLGHPLLALRDFTQAIRLAPRSAIAHYNRGQVFRDLGQAQQAVDDFGQAIRYRPLFAPAYNARGAVLESLQRYQEAMEDLNEAVRLAPDMADAFHNRGTVYLKLEQLQQALDDFSRALALNPDFAVAYNSRGTILLQLGKAMEALADFDAAILLQPDFGAALRNRGTVYQTTGLLQEAVSDYSRAIELEPDEPLTYIYRAGVYDQLGRPRDAVADFSEAIELDPNQAPVFYDRGVLQQQLGRLQDALRDFDQAIRLEPDFTAAYHDRANVKTGLGRLEDALADFSAAIRLDPDFLAAYLNRARLHLDLQQYIEAVQDFSEAIRLDPDLFEAHYQRGLIRHLQFRQLEEAAADFTEAIRIKPDHADAHNHRGEVQAALGNPDDARHDFDEALRLEPEHTEALYNRGLVFLELERPRDALDDFDAVDRLAPGQATVHHHRGQAREALGFLGAALDDYHAAIRLNPDYTEAYFRRGQVLQQFDRLAEALQDYTAAIRLDPELTAAWFRRSEVLTALELPVPALSDLAMVIRLDPAHVQAWLNRGILRQEQGDTARALVDYTEALRLDPDLAAAYRNRSAIHLENARLPEALSDLDALIELLPEEATAHYTRGDVHKTLDNPEEALRDYDQAVRLGIEETLLYYNRGAVKIVLGLTREAVEDFTAALQLNTDHVPSLHSRARAHQALGNLEPALSDLTEVIRLDPANAAAFHDRGMVQQGLQMPNAALADLDEAVRLDPHNAVAFHNRAFVKLSVRRYRNAIADFTTALELEPDYASAFHGRGSAWWVLVDHTKALADFNEAIRLNPTEADAFGQRGQVFLYMGLFDEALADFDQAIELNPEAARTYCDRGLVYRFLGESEAALADFNTTLDLMPNAYFALYYRANTLRDLKEPLAALDDYSRAVRLNPNFTHAFSRRSATYKELGQLPQALNDIDMAIQLNPGDASYYGERGLIRSALGQTDLARVDFQDAYCRFQRAGTSSGVDWIRSLAPNITAETVCD